nr:hypothetical protein [Tardiphaga alba]
MGAALRTGARDRDYLRGQSKYQNVDERIIWNALKNELPPLKEALLALQDVLADE